VSQIQSSNWSETAASNNATSPNGFPESMPAAGYNDSAREMMSAVKIWYNRISATAIATGSADALVLTYGTSPGAYASGMYFSFYKNASDNTGAVTLNVNALGAVAVVRRNGSTALSAADMVSGALYEVTHDGTSFRLHQTGI